LTGRDPIRVEVIDRTERQADSLATVDFEFSGERRLKVVHIAGWYPSAENPIFGVFVKEHVKATALYNDVVVLYGQSMVSTSDLYQLKKSIEDGICTLRFSYWKSPVPKTNFLIYMLSTLHTIRMLIKDGFRPDVIHAHEYMPAGLAAVLIGRLYGLPVVITEHYSGFPRGLVRGLSLRLAKFAFEHADLVCPVSEDLRRHIERLGIRARFHVVPNVVDTSLFYPSQEPSQSPDGKKRLLTVARLVPVKGIPYLLEALAILKMKRSDFLLDIVGDGPNRAEYEELTRRLGLQEFVRFHGVVSKPEVVDLMRKATCFVLSSEWENLPCVIIEAMASGLPVVATSVGGVPEIVNDELGKLVPSRDARSLAEAVSEVLTNPEHYKAQRLASNARQRFSYDVVGRMLTKIYKSIVAERTEGGI